MKTLGLIGLIIGCIWAFIMFNADPSVQTEQGRFANLILMDDRRNHLMMASLLILVGTILFIAGKFSSVTENKDPNRPPRDSFKNSKETVVDLFNKLKVVLADLSRKRQEHLEKSFEQNSTYQSQENNPDTQKEHLTNKIPEDLKEMAKLMGLNLSINKEMIVVGKNWEIMKHCVDEDDLREYLISLMEKEFEVWARK